MGGHRHRGIVGGSECRYLLRRNVSGVHRVAGCEDDDVHQEYTGEQHPKTQRTHDTVGCEGLAPIGHGDSVAIF